MQAKVFVSLEVSLSPSRHVLSSCVGITSPRLVACLWAALSHFRSFERTPNAIRHVCVYQCSFSIHRAMLILENFKPMDERERNFNGTQNNNTVPVSFELCQRHNSHDRTMFIHSHTHTRTHFSHTTFSLFSIYFWLWQLAHTIIIFCPKQEIRSTLFRTMFSHPHFASGFGK